jgi:23S rRNA (cytosine1962-C5)-methyltransferase
MWDALDRALAARAPRWAEWAAEGTDAVRVLHGATEGAPGLTVDRYGPVLLVQTWREPLDPSVLAPLAARVSEVVGAPLLPVWNHRPDAPRFARRHPVDLPEDPTCSELGLRFDARPRHRGHDPLLFLDLRAVRRRVRAHQAASVLNLFAYTGGVGVAAAAGGAREVWNVDFAASALEVAAGNAARNGVPDGVVRNVHHDAIPVLRMLAGLPVGRRRPAITLSPRTFELVVLDPPTRATGPWGAVDIVRDYPTLLKPALLATAPGGVLAATNHVASVAVEDWVAVLHRTAEKVGRRLEVELLAPESDFPSPDGRPPLKLAWCRVTEAG